MVQKNSATDIFLCYDVDYSGLKSAAHLCLHKSGMMTLIHCNQHEHKSVAQATRYANAGGGLRECEARSNQVINKLKVKKFYTRIEWVMK